VAARAAASARQPSPEESLHRQQPSRLDVAAARRNTPGSGAEPTWAVARSREAPLPRAALHLLCGTVEPTHSLMAVAPMLTRPTAGAPPAGLPPEGGHRVEVAAQRRTPDSDASRMWVAARRWERMPRPLLEARTCRRHPSARRWQARRSGTRRRLCPRTRCPAPVLRERPRSPLHPGWSSRKPTPRRKAVRQRAAEERPRETPATSGKATAAPPRMGRSDQCETPPGRRRRVCESGGTWARPAASHRRKRAPTKSAHAEKAPSRPPAREAAGPRATPSERRWIRRLVAPLASMAAV